MSEQSSSSLWTSLEKDGFAILRSVLPDPQLAKLRTAAASATALARSGGWPHIRTVGKQFPPWPSVPGPEGIWGVQHLMHPDLPGHDEFAALYFSDSILSPTRALITSGSCRDDELVMELFNMLVAPPTPFELRWHRDDIPPEATDAEELERLRQPAWHAQWNLALYDDDSLVVVPGSHARAKTVRERAASPFETGLDGEMRVVLAPGDVVFYDNNILHRGVYEPSGVRERMTLHGSVGHVGGSRARARNVLQHGVGAWVDRCDFSDPPLLGGERVRGRAEGMRERLVRMGRESGDVGYSLVG